jgi:hypothetical protein
VGALIREPYRARRLRAVSIKAMQLAVRFGPNERLDVARLNVDVRLP